MENLLSKTTLYDILSMIIPGFITLISLTEIFFWKFVTRVFGGSFVFPKYICIFALSYLIGLIIHYLAHFLFYWFKDCSCMMNCAYKKYHKTLTIKGEVSDVDKTGETNMIFREYYRKYYKEVKPGGTVSIMESQVAFLRSMLFVIPIGFRAICEYASHTPKFWLLLLIEVFVLMAMCYIQIRIYFRVFEDYHYHRIIEKRTQKKTLIEAEFSKSQVKAKIFPGNCDKE